MTHAMAPRRQIPRPRGMGLVLVLSLAGCGEDVKSWRAAGVPSPRNVVVLPFRAALYEFYVEDDPQGVRAPFSVESTAGCRRGLREMGVAEVRSNLDRIETDPAGAAAVARSVGADATVIGSLYTHKFSQSADVKLVRASDGAVIATTNVNGNKSTEGLARDACAALFGPGSRTTQGGGARARSHDQGALGIGRP